MRTLRELHGFHQTVVGGYKSEVSWLAFWLSLNTTLICILPELKQHKATLWSQADENTVLKLQKHEPKYSSLLYK